MSKKNKHGRVGVPKSKAHSAGSRDDLYARLATAEGQTDQWKQTARVLEEQLAAAELSLQEIVNACATTRTGAGKQARIIAQATLDGLQA